jgi:hypothetical protein
MGSNPGRRSDKLATNSLSYGTGLTQCHKIIFTYFPAVLYTLQANYFPDCEISLMRMLFFSCFTLV